MPPPPPKVPVFMYELRAGTQTAKGHDAGNLGKQGRVRVGDQRVLIERLSVDTVFHFHAYLDGVKEEIDLGNNWSVLRLLSRSSMAAQDGINWEIKMDKAYGVATLNVQLEQAITPIAQWPTRETLSLGQ
jgi:hypothetical protein